MKIIYWPLFSCLTISLLDSVCLGKILPNFIHEKDECCTKTQISDVNSRITNPSFPDADSEFRSYRYFFVMQESMCGLRLTFEKTKLQMQRGLTSPVCTIDSVTVIAKDFPDEPQCGNLENFQINVPTEAHRTIEVLVVAQSKKHLWSILVSQLKCENIDSKPLAKYADTCGQRPDSPFSNLPDISIPTLPAIGGLSVKEDKDKETDAVLLASNQQASAVGSTMTNDPDMFPCIGGNYLRCHLNQLAENKAKKSPLVISKIVNGAVAKRPWPWQVVMLVKGKHLLCGGALISDRIFLTAGHCIQAIQRSIDLKHIVIAAGVQQLGIPTFNAQFRKCGRAVINAQYADVHNDIGLCFFDQPLELSSSVQPVCLPTDESKLYAGEEAYITGWGKTSDDSGPSSILQEAEIPIVPNKDCQKAWVDLGGPQFADLIEDTHVCAGGMNKSTCNGDSGGPMVVNENGRYTLAGVVSFGPSNTCNIPDKPMSVFTRISSQLKFIALATAKTTGDLSNVKTHVPC